MLCNLPPHENSTGSPNSRTETEPKRDWIRNPVYFPLIISNRPENKEADCNLHVTVYKHVDKCMIT